MTITLDKPRRKVPTMDSAVNAVLPETASSSFWTESFSLSFTASTEPGTFAYNVRQAFKEHKLDDLIARAEADYRAGRALDSLD
jgi:hypothetical protein